MRRPQIITSWDDGHPLDLKLAELLDKYHLPGIFFVSLKNQVTGTMTKSQIRQLAKKFEIGAHTLNHVDLTKIPLKEAKKEIEGSKKALEDIIGKKVTKFCYPWGRANGRIIKLVKNAGYKSARTTNWFRTDKDFDPFRQPTTIHFYPHPFWENIGHCAKWKNWAGLNFYLRSGLPTSPVKLSQKFLKKAKTDGYFHLWGHSWEIEKLNLWPELESTLKFLKENQ